MSSFLERSLSGLVYATLFIGAVLYSQESYLILTSLFAFFCLREFQRLIHFNSVFTYLLLLGFIAYAVYLPDNPILNQILLVLTLGSSVQLMVYLFTKKRKYPLKSFQKFDVSVRYLIFSFGFLFLIPFINGGYEYQIILSLILFIWANDSFAYLIGKNFGRIKLFKSVSPKKTVEGFIGGVIFTIITGIVVSYYFNNLSMTHWIVLSVITSVLGTIGDLIESKFKRQAKKKDSGKIMPGHGGLLDRLDSLLFVAPFVYLYIHYII
ncbi:phosphatidate cytidylyltransferase [Pseudotenacibaculum sp. MALMAid0570]|uniref:phosphatidate cytidylyltransferase n=1 Tax=Pseudotenacibaculum sp. MALMAid0570 TaxID=3143938 RepID=UPI0032DFEB00